MLLNSSLAHGVLKKYCARDERQEEERESRNEIDIAERERERERERESWQIYQSESRGIAAGYKVSQSEEETALVVVKRRLQFELQILERRFPSSVYI